MIEQASRRLVDFPDSGRPGRAEGTRELVVSDTPYVMAYAVLPDRIRILCVLHAAQIWPDDISGM
jgi:plasmid stabilization system protein ParE